MNLDSYKKVNTYMEEEDREQGTGDRLTWIQVLMSDAQQAVL
ncbi:hypothetical protein QC762_606760 [Podospora pseudocomata]|uniref:Uncharacterized protein n=4 Tax=Podospora TaxID=5144 RepID=A0ABR0H5A3_9PEZI|nr:hypothetical protein QC761_606760 [Podospora bellae-mahoneyi]KAK4651918.1 hypothetical protein QC762_606760 [Podospora pseudocomata]KAK4663227.1 hypothetical protein QC763_606760 [Podospora pseudopauciseta]KAK4671541.1 hypothetical protein QC764_606760 [Podospora pseudoanserina]